MDSQHPVHTRSVALNSVRISTTITPTGGFPRSSRFRFTGDFLDEAEQFDAAPENILRIEDPKSIIDVMLGALALVGGQRDLSGYLQDMREREQHDLRQDQALATLGTLASSLSMARSQVSGSIPGMPQSGSSSSRSRRF